MPVRLGLCHSVLTGGDLADFLDRVDVFLCELELVPLHKDQQALAAERWFSVGSTRPRARGKRQKAKGKRQKAKGEARRHARMRDYTRTGRMHSGSSKMQCAHWGPRGSRGTEWKCTVSARRKQ